MKNITIILPIHTLDGDYKEMLKNATESIKDFHNDVTLSIVCPPSVASELSLDTNVIEYKVIENSDNYTLTTPLSKNGFGNNNFYLTNKSEVDVSGLYDENGFPTTSISYFFKVCSTNFLVIK